MNFSIYTSVTELTDEWDSIGDDIFLKTPYLTAQENATPKNIDYFYVAVFLGEEMAGKFVVQRIRIKGKNIFRSENKFREELLNLLNVNMLCVGNIKITGEHAWELKDGTDQVEFLRLIPNALKEIRNISKNENLPVKLLLIKDFYEETSVKLKEYFGKYERLSVQPNMVFKPKNNWKTFDDYLNAMRTKYRTRAKRAFKKSENVSFREFSISEIGQLKDVMYSQYQHVLANNSFSLYVLPENFFYEMKKHMPENFRVYGGFINEKLVCFYSLIENGKNLEAGFLGYDAQLQHDMQLYLNMLYRMINFSVSGGFESIDFSRTAMEIKSSAGAVPLEMYGFLIHSNPVMNRVLSTTFRKFYQPEEWIPRNPFKD